MKKTASISSIIAKNPLTKHMTKVGGQNLICFIFDIFASFIQANLESSNASSISCKTSDKKSKMNNHTAHWWRIVWQFGFFWPCQLRH